MKTVLTAKTIIIILSCLVLVGFAVWVATFVGDFIKENIVQNQECVSSTEKRTVRGGSLTGVTDPGETVKAFFGYYDCNEVKRGDIIIYSYAGSENPLVKIVKAIPGDRFGFQETEAGWHILVNEKVLKNSENKPYLLDERGHRMLSLYEKDYQGVIPEQAYLIMGNLVNGALDSSRYGLVHKDNILGKAEMQK